MQLTADQDTNDSANQLLVCHGTERDGLRQQKITFSLGNAFFGTL